MIMRNTISLPAVILFLSPFVVSVGPLSCSEKDDSKEISETPATAGRDNSNSESPTKLWDCEGSVGEPCNAHDSCAIDPVCGEDSKCYPSAYQECDDHLECTQDICLGLGMCENQPQDGTCVLPVIQPVTKKSNAETSNSTETVLQCFKKDDKSPNDSCKLCDPKAAPTKWSIANGGRCDDNDPCTKDDYCQVGKCKGIDYRSQCADEYSCTEDLCDGKGGCLGHKLRSDYCLINGTCYKAGANHPDGSCFTCDPTKSSNDWAAIPDACTIDNICYKPGDKHPGGCAECDISESSTGWTIKGDGCLIDNLCYKTGAKDPTGCSVCDPATANDQWTMLADVCKIGDHCYTKGETNAGKCAVCDPASSTTAWTVLSGFCLIDDLCYKASDKDKTGCSECDPQNSLTAWTPLSGLCKIDNKCYNKDDVNAGNCATCQPDISSTTWTVNSGSCLINNTCFQPGAKDTTGCGECNPDKASSTWTPVENTCLVGEKCYKDKDKDTTGCLVCDATKNPKGWSPTNNAKVQVYDFESGNTSGWTIKNSDSKVGWTVTSKRSVSGNYSLYYGDPVVGTFDTGTVANQGTASLPSISLSASKKAGLSFILWINTESGDSYDKLHVLVDNVEVWAKDKTITVQQSTWQEISIDLSKYAGKTVTIAFEFNTVDSAVNNKEGIYIDDITLFHDC